MYEAELIRMDQLFLVIEDLVDFEHDIIIVGRGLLLSNENGEVVGSMIIVFC